MKSKSIGRRLSEKELKSDCVASLLVLLFVEIVQYVEVMGENSFLLLVLVSFKCYHTSSVATPFLLYSVFKLWAQAILLFTSFAIFQIPSL